MNLESIGGVDYGSKIAGTTVLAFLRGGRIQLLYSERKKCADTFLKENIIHFGLYDIYIDAPLSLPGVFKNPDHFSDYFYREADRHFKAMSPMFLGGLTARAMQLKSELVRFHDSISFHEVYPGGFVRSQKDMIEYYKADLSRCLLIVSEYFNAFDISFEVGDIKNWHAFDALLALYIGLKMQYGQIEGYGNADEGLIYI